MIDVIIAIIFIVVLCVYLWLKQRYRYWENRQVPHLKPTSLIFGNESDAILGKLPLAENSLKHYNALAPHRFGGVYNFYKPLLYVRDPDLIKNILIKDFQYFLNRNPGLANEEDPLSLNLFNLMGEEWKVLRRKLSPTFTSGKMKIVFQLMKECAEDMGKILDKSAVIGEVVHVQDLMARYAIDVIMSCAFGLEADSLQNPDSEFRAKAKELVAPQSIKVRIQMALFGLSPALSRFLGFKMIPDHLADFFVNLVSDTIDYRNKNGIVRNDFLNLLMNLQKEETENTKTFSRQDPDFNIRFLTAQCFVFFFAGFEPASNTITFVLYQLSEHQDVQKKLQDEVDRILKKHGDEITYESLQEMRFMDQVFDETSRLFPVIPILFRSCTENYRIPNSDYIIRKGEDVFISVSGLHRDAQYYPNPDAFNPENFSDEAKASRPSCCFLPFGDGPRNCIGMRFAIMQVKIALAVIMKEYTVTKSAKMQLPIELKPLQIISSSKTEILLKFNKRNK